MKIRFLNLLLVGSIVSSVILSSCKKDPTPESPDYSENQGEFKDTRDGTIYKWVKIGNQIWMAENLNYEYGNSWAYENNPVNSDVYGRLYDWNTALTSCPDGWHIPTDVEWNQMENNLRENGYSYDGVVGHTGIAKSLATDNLWTISDIEGAVGNSDYSEMRNKTGFSALPGGGRSYDGGFGGLGHGGLWWSATEANSNLAYRRSLVHNSAEVNRRGIGKSGGFSVRCVRD